MQPTERQLQVGKVLQEVVEEIGGGVKLAESMFINMAVIMCLGRTGLIDHSWTCMGQTHGGGLLPDHRGELH